MTSIRLVQPEEPSKRPRSVNKRVWASVERKMTDVIEEGFREALHRYPKQQRSWVVLVDGQTQQLDAVRAAAKRHRVNITVVCDFIHVMEYLWKAAHCFHQPGSNAARLWVAERARMLLEGTNPSQVAAGMRRSATRQQLGQRKAKYLKKRRKFMRYADALAKGMPIASGAIEGACRHLVRDRLDCCGARWHVNGAESILKLRTLACSGDLDDYWAFHLRCEHKRNHAALYADAIGPAVGGNFQRDEGRSWRCLPHGGPVAPASAASSSRRTAIPSCCTNASSPLFVASMASSNGSISCCMATLVAIAPCFLSRVTSFFILVALRPRRTGCFGEPSFRSAKEPPLLMIQQSMDIPVPASRRVACRKERL